MEGVINNIKKTQMLANANSENIHFQKKKKQQLLLYD